MRVRASSASNCGNGRLGRVFYRRDRDGLHREGPRYPDHAAHDPGAVVEHFLRGVALDARVDFLTLPALEFPETTQGRLGFVGPILRWHRIGHLAQALPAVPGQPIDRLQERFRLLLGAQLARPLERKKVSVRLSCLLGPDGMGDFPRHLPFFPLLVKRPVELGQRLVNLRLVSGGDGVNFGVPGDGLQRNMGHGFVNEAPGGAAFRVFEFVVVELRRHQPLAGDGQSHAAGIAGNPAPSPLLGAVGGSAGAAGGVEDQVARVGGHQNAALDDFGVGLDGVELWRPGHYLVPDLWK
jgi:hypothetical protein